MTLSNKANFIVLLIMTSVFFAGCFSNSKTPRRTTTVSDGETNSTNSNSSENNTIILVDDASNPNDSSPNDTGNKSGGSDQTVVQFNKGGTSKSYSNTLGKGKSYTYILRVSAGQTMTVEMDQAKMSDALFTIKDTKGKNLSATSGGVDNFDETVNQSGNYKIIVTAGNLTSEYNIKISVTGSGTTASQGSSDGDFTKTVKFGAGKSSASHSAKFNATGPDNQTYILGANSGQKMTVTVNSSDVAFTIVSPNGKTLANQTTSYTGTLPDNGNYRVTINPNRARFASYRINFAIR